MTCAIPLLLTVVSILTNCADVSTAVYEKKPWIPFELTGTALVTNNRPNSVGLLLADDTGGIEVWYASRMPGFGNIRSGDQLRVYGKTIISSEGKSFSAGERFQILGHLPENPTPLISGNQLRSGHFDLRIISIRGRVIEVFRDEIDPNALFISLDATGDTVYLTCKYSADREVFFRKLREATVIATGLVHPGTAISRRSLGRSVNLWTHEAVQIITPPPDDFFAAPTIPISSRDAIQEVYSASRRHATGTVIAVLQDGRILIQDDKGETRNVRIATSPLPVLGRHIEVVGLPETDFYRINLTDADWRPSVEPPRTFPDHLQASKDVLPITFEELLTDGEGNVKYKPDLHGKTIRVCGTIIDQPIAGSTQRNLTLKDNGLTLPIDLTSAVDTLKRIAIGCRVEVTGVCIVETESWHPYARFPHATGVTVAPRTSADIIILAQPPWWTPPRLFALVVVLFLLVVIIAVWNRFLRRIVDRKSHELANERISSFSSRFRVAERTRLAVELHDTLSQNLTGITFQLDASLRARATNPEAAERHLKTAMNTLSSCRIELGRCLWDLRSAALDEPDFSEAIRKVIQPIIHTAKVSIRFLIPRNRLGDATAHAVLRIIRELVANALRHGCATSIRIAGDISTGALMFSVADNGCGFDPYDSPGPREGHFGLAGIRERVKGLQGSVTIFSVPGEGTKIKVKIPTPKSDVTAESFSE